VAGSPQYEEPDVLIVYVRIQVIIGSMSGPPLFRPWFLTLRRSFAELQSFGSIPPQDFFPLLGISLYKNELFPY